MTTVPIVAIDTETTGLDSRRRLAWDVAMIRRDDQGEQEYQFFIDIDLSDADPFALNIGGFYKRHSVGRLLAHRPQANQGAFTRPDNYYSGFGVGRLLTPQAAAVAIAQVTHGAHLIGAIPSFDTITLEELLRNNGLTPAWHYHIMDVEAMAVGYLAAQNRRHGSLQSWQSVTPPWKSDDLGRAIGVEPPSEEERHTAVGDARMALRWYDTIMGITTPAVTA